MGIEPTALCLGRTLVGLIVKVSDSEIGVKLGQKQGEMRPRWVSVVSAIRRLASQDRRDSKGQPDVFITRQQAEVKSESPSTVTLELTVRCCEAFESRQGDP
jgi:hypothetical protein